MDRDRDRDYEVERDAAFVIRAFEVGVADLACLHSLTGCAQAWTCAYDVREWLYGVWPAWPELRTSNTSADVLYAKENW